VPEMVANIRCGASFLARPRKTLRRLKHEHRSSYIGSSRLSENFRLGTATRAAEIARPPSKTKPRAAADMGRGPRQSTRQCRRGGRPGRRIGLREVDGGSYGLRPNRTDKRRGIDRRKATQATQGKRRRSSKSGATNGLPSPVFEFEPATANFPH